MGERMTGEQITGSIQAGSRDRKCAPSCGATVGRGPCTLRMHRASSSFALLAAALISSMTMCGGAASHGALAPAGGAASRASPVCPGRAASSVGGAWGHTEGAAACLRLRGGKGKRGRSGKRKGGYVRKKDTHLRKLRYEREIAAGIRKPVRMGDANLSLKDAAEDDADMDMGLVPVLDLPLVEGRVVKPIRRKDGTRQIVTAEFAQALVQAQRQGDRNKQLMVCLDHGMLKEARRLIDAGGVNINHRVDQKTLDTPLHRAIRRNDIDAAELLLIKGADLFTDNGNFENPTKMAMNKCDTQMFALLTKYGGRPVEVRRHQSRR